MVAVGVQVTAPLAIFAADLPIAAVVIAVPALRRVRALVVFDFGRFGFIAGLYDAVRASAEKGARAHGMGTPLGRYGNDRQQYDEGSTRSRHEVSLISGRPMLRIAEREASDTKIQGLCKRFANSQR